MTDKERIAIEAFNPDATNWEEEMVRACCCANYALPEKSAKDLLKRPSVLRELKHREEYGMSEVELNRKRRKEFWQSIMGNRVEETKDRLRASELWGKSEGDFVHRVEAEIHAVDEEERYRRALEGSGNGDETEG